MNTNLKEIVMGLIATANSDPFCSVGYWVEHGPHADALVDIQRVNDLRHTGKGE